MTKKFKSKQLAFDALIEHAPKYRTVESLCEGIGLPSITYYKWTEDRPDIRKAVTDNLAERYSIRSQESDDGSVTITIHLSDAQAYLHKRYTEEQKTQLTDMICYAYEKGVSIAVSCKALKMDDSTFFSWANPEAPNYFPYTYERYKLAKMTRKMSLEEADTFTARVALNAKLRNRVVTNTTRYYEVSGIEGEKVILKGITEQEKTVHPEISAIALVLNNLDPDFRKATAGGQMIDDKDYRYLSDEELIEELNKEQERQKILNPVIDDKTDR